MAVYAGLIFATDLGQTLFSNIGGYLGDMLAAKQQRLLSYRYYQQVLSLPQRYFDTELTRPLVENAEFTAWLKNRTPAQRWGNVKELEGAVVFLASAASDFVNGHVLYVDGGMLASL